MSILGPGSGGWMQGESPVKRQPPEPWSTSTGQRETCGLDGRGRSFR